MTDSNSYSSVITADGINQLTSRDHGFTVGDGVFETLQTSSQGILSLDRHLRRLYKSAEMVGLPKPDIDLISHELDSLKQTAVFQNHQVGRLRITWTGGQSELGSLRSGAWTLAIDWTEARPWPKTSKLAISSVKKFSAAASNGAKTTSYIENVMALNQAKNIGFDEAALLNEKGLLAEGTGSNIFLIAGTQVLTPPLSDGALGGITREVLLEIEPRIQEAHIDRSMLESADSVFLTSSTRDLQQVEYLEGAKLVTDNPIFLDLSQRYSAAKSQEWR